LNWLNESVNEAATQNARLHKRREEADRAKANDPTLDDRYVDDDASARNQMGDQEGEDGIGPIDPRLTGAGATPWQYGANGFVDPALQEANGITYTFNDESVPPSTSRYPEPPEPPQYHEDTRDAEGSPAEYVAPFAVMRPDGHGDLEDVTEQQNLQKRPRGDEDQIKLAPLKKRRKKGDDIEATPESSNRATKQFRAEKERKLLEDAKKKGRFIITLAKLRRRSRIAKLPLNSSMLREFAAKEAAKPPSRPAPTANGAGTPPINILQSDLNQEKDRRGSFVNGKAKKPNQVRYRVEEDDDFYTSYKRGATANAKMKTKAHYEEIDLDEEEDDDMENMGFDTSTRTRNNNNADGRRSSWLARKNRDADEDAPTELPSNWKDTRANTRNSNRDPERRRTMPAPPKPAAMKAPRIRPVRSSTGNMNVDGPSDDADGSPDRAVDGTAGEAPIASMVTPFSAINKPTAVVTPAAPKQSAAAIAMAKAAEAALEEENRKAKLEAAGIFWDADAGAGAEGQGDGHGGGDSVMEVEEQVEAAVGKPVQPPQASMVNKPGMKGKNVTIVGAVGSASRTTETDKDDEKSSSAGEIPAKRGFAKTRGRSTLPGILTRGSGRGRGIPTRGR